MNFPVELFLAAFVEQEGEIFIGAEYLDRSYEGKALALEPDMLRDGVVISLVDESEVTYDDESDDNE